MGLSTVSSIEHPKLLSRLVVATALLVALSLGLGAHEVPNEVTVLTFIKPEGKTLTLLMRCGTKQLRDTIIQSGMEFGMQEQMNLLEELAISLMS